MPGKHPLSDVKTYIQTVLNDHSSEKVMFSAEPKSTLAVVQAFRKKGNPVSQAEARIYILNGIMALTDADFIKSVGGQWGDPRLVVDQYGIRKNGIPWFVKFLIEKSNPADHFLEEISFHPTDQAMVLENKTIISEKWED